MLVKKHKKTERTWRSHPEGGGLSFFQVLADKWQRCQWELVENDVSHIKQYNNRIDGQPYQHRPIFRKGIHDGSEKSCHKYVYENAFQRIGNRVFLLSDKVRE